MRYGCLWRSAEACSTPHNLPAPDLVVPGSGHQEVGLGVEAQARDGVIRRLNDLVRLVRVGIGKSGAGQEGGHRSPMRMEVPPILSLSLSLRLLGLCRGDGDLFLSTIDLPRRISSEGS